MPTDILLIGAGGHAKVVYSALRLQLPGVRARIVDDEPRLQGSSFLDLIVEGPPADWARLPVRAHICVGGNAVRQSVAEKMQALGKKLFSVIHPAAIISEHADIADGAFIAAGAIVGPNARIGTGVIINHAAVVDHDCRIGAFTHVAPNATLGGDVEVGVGVLVGAGAILLPGLTLGDRVVVGAGAVVNRSVASGQTVIGIPARAR